MTRSVLAGWSSTTIVIYYFSSILQLIVYLQSHIGFYVCCILQSPECSVLSGNQLYFGTGGALAKLPGGFHLPEAVPGIWQHRNLQQDLTCCLCHTGTARCPWASLHPSCLCPHPQAESCPGDVNVATTRQNWSCCFSSTDTVTVYPLTTSVPVPGCWAWGWLLWQAWSILVCLS